MHLSTIGAQNVGAPSLLVTKISDGHQYLKCNFIKMSSTSLEQSLEVNNGMFKLNCLTACYVMVNYPVWIFDNIPQARIANDMRLPNSYIVWFIDMLYSCYWILECKDCITVGFPINRTHLTSLGWNHSIKPQHRIKICYVSKRLHKLQ